MTQSLIINLSGKKIEPPEIDEYEIDAELSQLFHGLLSRLQNNDIPADVLVEEFTDLVASTGLVEVETFDGFAIRGDYPEEFCFALEDRLAEWGLDLWIVDEEEGWSLNGIYTDYT